MWTKMVGECWRWLSNRYPRFDFNAAALECSPQDEVADSQSEEEEQEASGRLEKEKKEAGPVSHTNKKLTVLFPTKIYLEPFLRFAAHLMPYFVCPCLLMWCLSVLRIDLKRDAPHAALPFSLI